eukprot:806024-Prorocentrum_minimum.AAC.2
MVTSSTVPPALPGSWLRSWGTNATWHTFTRRTLPLGRGATLINAQARGYSVWSRESRNRVRR